MFLQLYLIFIARRFILGHSYFCIYYQHVFYIITFLSKESFLMSVKGNFNSQEEEEWFNHMKFDDSAFEVFFKQHFTSLCVYCQYKFSFDLSLAKEVVHTAFIKLWETRSKLSADLSIKTYLIRIIINNSLDILKHEEIKKKHRSYIINTNDSSFENKDYKHVDVKQLSADIDRTIAELPEQMRKVFELSRYEGLKYSAIAVRLKISVKTVETQMSRALVKLREKLADHLSLYLILLWLGWLFKVNTF